MKSNSLAKRALALALSMVMCVGMLQITALAVDGDEGSEPNAITDTGVPVVKEDKEPTTDDTTGTSTDGWTASGTDEKGVQVDIDSTTTVKDIPAKTDDDGNVTEPGKTETTESVDTTLTEKGEDHVLVPDLDAKDVAPTEKEDMEVANPLAPKGPDSSVELKGNGENGGITVSADVGNGHQNNTVSDSKETFLDYDAIKDQVEALRPNTDDWGTEKKDDSGKSYWEKPGEKDNQVIRTSIEEIKDANDNVIGYKTITQTVETIEGKDYIETGTKDYIATDPENPLDPVKTEGTVEAGDVPTKAPALPEKPEVGAVVGDETVTAVTDNKDGSYTVTYEKVTGEPTSTPRVDENGQPVLDDNGEQIVDLVYPTETRTETFKREESEETYQVEVEEERKDTIIVDTVVDVNKVEIDKDTPSLKLDLVMEKPVEDNGAGITAPDGGEIPDEFFSQMKGLDDYLDQNAIGVNFLVGTQVTVEQTKTGSNAYSANATIKLNLNKSQLDDSFVLEVNGTKYRIPGTAVDSDDNVLEFDENGNVKDIIVGGVQTGTISLQLTGKQTLNPTAADLGWGDCTSSSFPLVKDINLSANIHVTITEIKGDVMYEQFKKTEQTEDTKTFVRTDTVTESKSSLTTTKTDAVAGTKEDTTTRPLPEVPDEGGETPTTPGGGTGGGGTGGGGGDTPVIDVPDPEVPLTDLPETPEEPEEEVIIPDEDVPLAEGPEEVDILDEDVPLAAVPQTGDISSLWYLATLASACGLGALTLRKKED